MLKQETSFSKKISDKKILEVMNIKKVENINNDKFWRDYTSNRPMILDNLDDSNWMSQSQATVEANRFTLDYILRAQSLASLETNTRKSIGKLLSISEHIIKEEVDKGRIHIHPTKKSRFGNPHVWWPDVLNLAVGFAKTMEARIVDLMGEMKVGDLSKYLIADISQFRNGTGLNETQVNYLWKLHNDFFSNDYILVPKNATEEEKLKLIKNN